MKNAVKIVEEALDEATKIVASRWGLMGNKEPVCTVAEMILMVKYGTNACGTSDTEEGTDLDRPMWSGIDLAETGPETKEGTAETGPETKEGDAPGAGEGTGPETKESTAEVKEGTAETKKAK